MRIGPSRRTWFGTSLKLAVIALVLAGCFQTAGDVIEPTLVNLTSIAPTFAASATPFITPISTGGFITPTVDPNSLPTATQIEPTNPPPTDMPAVEPTQTLAVFPPTNQPEQPTETLPPPPANPTVEQSLTNPTVEPPPSNPTAFAPTSAPPTQALLPTPTALATEGPCVHTVQPGEWLYSIARKYNINPQDLLAANPALASNPDSLSPGDVLNIPNCNKTTGQAAPTTVPTVNAVVPPTNAPDTGGAVQPTPIQVSGRTYTVASGDTLGMIARKFDTTVQALKDANGLTSDALSVGQVLKIPK
ncbi:MAG: LysM peptidoglycan-binding domain-containing protein [Anaerolineae bacterium]|nr:LysM peptidoglycan-binding domain-containing protein [Anaerolineae bacterium]